MSAVSHIENRMLSLTPVLDEHLVWLGELNKIIFFPDSHDGTIPDEPAALSHWLADNDKAEFVDDKLTGDLKEIHARMGQKAKELVSLAKTGDDIRPAYESFSEMSEHYVQSLRRLERDSLIESSGMDRLTGLRNSSVMKRDIQREMERLARQGRPFCLAMGRIDEFEIYRRHVSEGQQNDWLQLTADILKRGMRIFDDAYRLKNGEFMLNLKNTDSSGGLAALKRMSKMAEKLHLFIEADGRKHHFSLSFTIIEPTSNDNIDALIEQLHRDLEQNVEAPAAILQMRETSELEKYLNEIKE